MLEEKNLAPRGDCRLVFRVGVDDEEIPFLEVMFDPRGDFEDIDRSLEDVLIFRDDGMEVLQSGLGLRKGFGDGPFDIPLSASGASPSK